MKKYKLLKDLPDLKAGAVFEFDEFKYYSCGNYHTYCFHHEELERYPDWFQEIKERTDVESPYLGPVARAWCRAEVSNKEMDVNLAIAITKQLEEELGTPENKMSEKTDVEVVAEWVKRVIDVELNEFIHQPELLAKVLLEAGLDPKRLK